MTHPYSLTQLGPSDLQGNNYYLTIKSGTNEIINLWALDTNEDNCLGLRGWGCIDP